MSADILIIEDNPANSDLIAFLLKAYGHRTRIAVTGEEGIQEIRRAAPDLVICDIHLPGMDGYAVARILKEDAALRHVPLVAVTALAMVGDRERVLRAGFDGYLAKPIDPENFMAHVDDYLPAQVKTPPTTFVRAVASVDAIRAAPIRATVLVVDDRPVNLSLARNIFEPHGYRVLTAASMQQGLQRAREQRPDVIMSDVNMGDGSGFDFLAAIRADLVLCRVPFILNTSTHHTEEVRARALAQGADRFLAFPLEPAVILAEVERCLRRSRGV